MTECERLIKSGFIPEHFLDDEVRCEYSISSKMKKVWALSMDLIQQVEQLCKKHGLQYFAIGGTALGAVRHKGFIPWDDDIDIAMLRNDYNIFLKIAQKELEFPYFLQTVLTDPAFYNSAFARLRNSATTAISPGDERKQCNNGIFIDVFPLDGYEDVISCKSFIYKSKIQSKFAWNSFHYRTAKNNKMLRTIMKMISPLVLMGDVTSFYKRHEYETTLLSNKYTRKVGIMYSFFGYVSRRLIWQRSIFDDIVYFPFEYTALPLPGGYDEMLGIMYGDYMKFPPKEVRGKHHNLEIEPDIDYKTYCSNKYGVAY